MNGRLAIAAAMVTVILGVPYAQSPTATRQLRDGETVYYDPSAPGSFVAPIRDAQAARGILEKGLVNMSVMNLGDRRSRIVSVQISDDSLVLLADKEQDTLRLSWLSIDPVATRRKYSLGGGVFVIGAFSWIYEYDRPNETPNWKPQNGWLKNPKNPPLPSLAEIASAVLFLKNAALARQADAAFQPVLQAYLRAYPKPELPEDARRYWVQAQAAIRDQQFAEAIDLLRRGLGVAPWWPEGHFNLALALSKTNRYVDAMNEMKRYLALAPDAPNGRAAQDLMYEWERAANKPSKN